MSPTEEAISKRALYLTADNLLTVVNNYRGEVVDERFLPTLRAYLRGLTGALYADVVRPRRI